MHAEYQSEVETERFSLNRVNFFKEVSTINDIYPGLIRKDSYVYLGYANVNKVQANISYGGSNIIYHFPIRFLDENKNLLYNNSGVKIYR